MTFTLLLVRKIPSNKLDFFGIYLGNQTSLLYILSFALRKQAFIASSLLASRPKTNDVILFLALVGYIYTHLYTIFDLSVNILYYDGDISKSSLAMKS